MNLTLHVHHHHGTKEKAALGTVIFNGVFTVAWFISMIGMGLHWVLPNSHALSSYYNVCTKVAFVTFLSLYCNFVSQLAALMASVTTWMQTRLERK
jgi:hypothetical protein